MSAKACAPSIEQARLRLDHFRLFSYVPESFRNRSEVRPDHLHPQKNREEVRIFSRRREQ